MQQRRQMTGVLVALWMISSVAVVLGENYTTTTTREDLTLAGDHVNNTTVQQADNSTEEAQARQAAAEEATSLWHMAECFSEDEVSDCLEQRTSRALRIMLDITENSRAPKAMSEEELNEVNTSSPSQGNVANSIGQIIGEGLTRLIPMLIEDDDEEVEDDGENGDASQDDSEDEPENKSSLKGESRKKKKKKLLMKIHNLIQKLFMLKLLIKSKFAMILMKLSLLVQLKLVLIVLANLLVNIYRLYLQKTQHHEPQKVIYYEHAQHQHHYDQEHFHHGTDDDKGWLGSLWSRSVLDEPSSSSSSHDTAYSAHRPVYTDSPHVPVVRRDHAPRLPFITPKPLLG